MAKLPPPDTKRWVASRKAAVVTAVHDGRITMEEALNRYQLTKEELVCWQRVFESHGTRGLRATFVQQYREPQRCRTRGSDPPDCAGLDPSPPGVGGSA